MLVSWTVGYGYDSRYTKLLFALSGDCKVCSVIAGGDQQHVCLRGFGFSENFGFGPVFIEDSRIRDVGYLLATFLFLLYDSELVLVARGEILDQVHPDPSSSNN